MSDTYTTLLADLRRWIDRLGYDCYGGPGTAGLRVDLCSCGQSVYASEPYDDDWTADARSLLRELRRRYVAEQRHPDEDLRHIAHDTAESQCDCRECAAWVGEQEVRS